MHVKKLCHTSKFKSVVATMNPSVKKIALTFIHDLHLTSVAGSSHSICVKNQSPDEVLRVIQGLRDQWGIDKRRLKDRKFTRHPSVQGLWKPDVPY
jgi:hypothetical protein